MAMSPMMGSPLQSPDTDTRPGVARPSSMLGPDSSDSKEGASEDSPDRRISEVLMRVHSIETQMEALASSYPAAQPNLEKAVKALREASKQIVATGSGQEAPNPRMLG
jgi:hypothetical protein